MAVLTTGEWAARDAMALAGLVRRGEATARELAAQAAEQAAALDPALRAVAGWFEDAIDNPDADGPDPAGALRGVPVLLKDLGSGLAGRRQDSGSRLTRGTVVAATDPLIANALRAGMTPIGRSATPEFGMTFDTAVQLDAEPVATRNPWDPDRTPGGSSGGAAALVAAGALPMAMASDGGGSIRLPAAFCGLLGLKPSRGRVPPPLWRNEYMSRVSVEGVVCRTARDAALIHDYLVRIPRGGAFVELPPPAESYLRAVERDPPQLRIALSLGPWGRDAPVAARAAERVRDAARLMESLGHIVEEIQDAEICDWPLLWDTYVQHWIGSRAAFDLIARERGLGRRDLQTSLAPMTWRHYVASERYGKLDALRMAAGNNAVTRQWGAFLDRYDVLLTPVAAIRAPRANGPYSLLRDESLDDWLGRLVDACRFTMPANETGLPAIAVPAGLDDAGMPVGVQFHGRFGAEATLLGIAAQIERARPDWSSARPRIHVAAPTGAAGMGAA